MSDKKVLYEELLPEEFIERINEFPVDYLPLGTLEWHGLHLPLGADGIQACGVFERIARDVGGVILPMLFLGPDSVVMKDDVPYFGMDHISFEEGHPQQLQGSAYHIEKEQFCALLDTILQNLSRAGFKVVVAHGHGPSIHAFAERKQVFLDRFGLLTYTLFDLGYRGDEGIQTDHAATNETSLVMALRPELADIEKLAPEGIPVGVWGEDPRKAASAEHGRALIEKNAAQAVRKLQEIVANLSYEKRTLDYRYVKSKLR